MIRSRKDLYEIIECEKNIYCWSQVKIFIFFSLFKYMFFSHSIISYKSFLLLIIQTPLYRRKKNRIGLRLGIEMSENSIGKGAIIYHPNSIVINGYSKIGENCKFHGNNCVGNDGKSLKSPMIGNNVRLGVGAKVIGDIILADNITVAAGAVVVDSFLEEGIVIGGVPARKIK